MEKHSTPINVPNQNEPKKGFSFGFSKRTGIVLVLTAFLAVGLIASFIVVQDTVDIRNRAADLSCKKHMVTCSWNFEDELPAEVTKVEYEYSVLGPCNGTAENPCSGTTSETSIEFEGFPGGTYTCNVEPKVYVGDTLCPASGGSGTDSCPLEMVPDSPELSPPDDGTIPDEPVGACGCAEDGGRLECNPEIVEKYNGELGPGLIILNPVYEAGDNACFVCQKLVVKDSSGTIIKEIDGCASDTEIRLHQAPLGEGDRCETYTIAAIGENQDDNTEETCQTCEHEVCCPACVPVETLQVEIGSQNSTEYFETELIDSCAFDCDFDVTFGGGNACGSVNEPITLDVPAGDCVTIDDDYAGSQLVCDDDGDGKITIRYDRGGVYDISLNCSGRTFSVDVPSDGTAVQSAPPSDPTCKKRITVACGGGDIPDDPDTPDTPDTPDDPDTPDTPDTPDDPDTPDTPEDPFCEELDVQIYCRNCGSLGLPETQGDQLQIQ